MAQYHGDIKLGDTIDIQFTTVQATGAPFTLAGSPVISAYIGNSPAEITAGITLSVDFDSRTGFNNVRVVATGGNGFAVGTNVSLVITTGTVNSVSVVGYCIGSFSIENRVWNTNSINLPVGPIPALGIVENGVAASVTSTTLTTRTLGSTPAANAFKDRSLYILGNGGQYEVVTVNGSTAADPSVLSFDAPPNAPTGTPNYIIGAQASQSSTNLPNVVVPALAAAQAEPVAVPAANASPLSKLAWIAQVLRNKITNDGSSQIVKADDGTTTVGTAPVSESGGTTTRGKFV